MLSDPATIMITGTLAAAACALPGAFLVLRGMSLLGDAISHAVLPGIVIAFLITGEIASWPVLLGAGVTGLLTVFLIEVLTRTKRIKEDASIAVVFPALFALGVLLLAQFAGQTDLDQDCVLYGEILYAPLDVMTIGGLTIARPLVVLAVMTLLNLALVLVLTKELQVATFDAAFATAIGLSPVVVHYVLMGFVSVTTVAAFESVGAILVVAFLIVPPAAAHLLTDRLGLLLSLSVAIGAGSAVAGYLVAREYDASIAGCMAGCMGVAFLAAWMLSPRRGMLATLWRRSRLRDRYASALAIEKLGLAKLDVDALAADLAWSTGRAAQVVSALESQGLIESDGDAWRPTAEGRSFAREVVGDSAG